MPARERAPTLCWPPLPARLLVVVGTACPVSAAASDVGIAPDAVTAGLVAVPIGFGITWVVVLVACARAMGWFLEYNQRKRSRLLEWGLGAAVACFVLYAAAEPIATYLATPISRVVLRFL